MRLDAHQHFWDYNPVDYGWIDSSCAIARSFSPADLRPLLDHSGLDGCIAVQARTSEEETAWLCRLSNENQWIFGVVGWIDLCADDIDNRIARLRHPKLVGYRHIIQGETNDHYILRSDFNRGIRALVRANLSYDILVLPKHLPHVKTFIDQHPDARLIIDHASKPNLRSGDITHWQRDLTDIARRPHVSCKLSGLVTEADHAHWTDDQLRRILDICCTAFTPQRCLFGSDWPVCTLAASYERWYAVVSQWAAALSASEQAAIFGDTAARFYNLTIKNTKDLR